MSDGYGAGYPDRALTIVPHLYVYWAPALGVWVAQCEQLFTRPWTYASEKGWEQAMHQGLAHLYMHPRGRISASAHSGGDELTKTNGRLQNPFPGRHVCKSEACRYAWDYDGHGTWTGPYWPDGGGYPRKQTGWQLWYNDGDCARSILGGL